MESQHLAPGPVEPPFLSPEAPEGNEDPMDQFSGAIRSPSTRRFYESWLAHFLTYAKTTPREIVRLGKSDPKKVEGKILAYVATMKEDGLKPGTIRTRMAPIKLLLEMNDVPPLNWKKIGKFIPPQTVAEDRAPTLEEVRAIAGDTDPRVKVSVLLMASGGLRIGALETLRVKHVEPQEQNGRVVAARVKVYQGTREEYPALVTPEAWEALAAYLNHRRENGEKIGPDSPILRNRYEAGKAGKNVATLSISSLQNLLNRRYYRLGMRKAMEQKDGRGRARHEFAGAHGFRKFFKTRAEQHMKPLNVETCLGHSTGLAGRYYRPRESEVLEDYLKAVPALTIMGTPGDGAGAEKVQELEKRLQRAEAALAMMNALDGVKQEAERIGMDTSPEKIQRLIAEAVDRRLAELAAGGLARGKK